MATHLDLEEQEQLDQLKAFWKQYGNLITWVLILRARRLRRLERLELYQRDQGVESRLALRRARPRRPDRRRDRATRIFADMKERYPRATFTHQAGLVAARVAAEKGQYDAAQASLAWVADNASEDEYRAIARLRLAGLLLDTKKYDEALKQLDAVTGRPGVRRPGRRPARRHPADAGQERRSASGVPEGLDGDGSEARLPPPRRGQAEPARRRSRRRPPRAASRRRSDAFTAGRAASVRAPRRRWPRRWRSACSPAAPCSTRCSAPRSPSRRSSSRSSRRSRSGRPGTRASAQSSSRSPSPSTATC